MEDRALLIDRVRIEGRGPVMQAAWGLAGYPVLGTLIAAPLGAEAFGALRQSIPDPAGDVQSAITLVDQVVILRGLAHHADALKRHFFQAWAILRPILMGRPATAPRIWAT
jgi:urease accessory protein